MRTLVSPPRLGHGARALGAVEVVLALALVLLDWFLPALLLCVLAGASLLVAGSAVFAAPDPAAAYAAIGAAALAR